MGAVLVGLENSVNLKDESVLRQSDLVVNAKIVGRICSLTASGRCMIQVILCKIKSVILHEEKDRLPFVLFLEGPRTLAKRQLAIQHTTLQPDPLCVLGIDPNLHSSLDADEAPFSLMP
jgi:hypothetical protein